MALDGWMREDLIFPRPDVDIDGLIEIGRRYRVVGLSYATDYRTVVYFDPEIDKITTTISNALASESKVWIADSSVDERKLLLFPRVTTIRACTTSWIVRLTIWTPFWWRGTSW